MSEVLAIIGSPRKDGLSSKLADSALAGASEAGAPIRKIFLCDYEMEACRDCVELGCYGKGDCNYDDDFEKVSEMIDAARSLVLATPVYWGDVSNSTRWLFNKKMRVRSEATNGLPAYPIAVAGGTGNGMLEALKPLYLAFEKLRFRSLGAFPVTRFNLAECHEKARLAGQELVRMAEDRRPLDLVELFTHYNGLPYRAPDRIDERLLLAKLIVEGIQPIKDPLAGELAGKLKEAEGLAARDKNGAVPLINEICSRGQPLFDHQ